MKLKKALVLILTLCMIFSIMTPAASAVQSASVSNVKPGADTVTSNALKDLSTNAGEAGGVKTLKDDQSLLIDRENMSFENGKWVATISDGVTIDLTDAQLPEDVRNLRNESKYYTNEDVVCAFVTLEAIPAVEQYSSIHDVPAQLTNTLLEQQNALIAAIEQDVLDGDELNVVYQFTYLTNSIVVETEFGNLQAIAAMSGVKSVFLSPVYYPCETSDTVYPATDSSSVMTNVAAVWQELGYTGKGMTIAILDTGLDLDHPSFAAAPEGAAWSVEWLQKMLDENDLVLENLYGKEITAEDLYYNEKIPFAFNYASRTLNVLHNDGVGDHGTHVAGIAAANKVDNINVIGMAPDAQIIAMKVFSPSGGASMATVIAALEDCMKLGVDVANLSLGSAAGFSESGSKEIDSIFSRIAQTDLIVDVAGGNEGTSSYGSKWGYNMQLTDHIENGVISSPSTYANSMSVASADNKMVATDCFRLADDTNIAYMYSVEYIYGYTGVTLSNLKNMGVLEYVVIDGLGYAEEFYDADGNSLVSGKVALIKRGTISFAEKVLNAQDAGAVAAIIWNTDDSNVFTFGMTTATTDGTIPEIPVGLITLSDGQKMADAETKTLYIPDEPMFREDPDGGQISSFSSWGTTSDLRLIPDIAGIGGSVLSCYDGGAYGVMSGTSMACPQVAGVTTLLLQYLEEKFPEATDAEKRVLADSLLMSTAVAIIDNDSLVEASPRQQGAGLVDALAAITAEAYLTVEGSNRPKAELFDNANGIFTFAFTVHNFSNAEKTYTLRSSLLAEDFVESYGLYFLAEQDKALDNSAVTFSSDTVTVPAGGSETVAVIIELTEEDKQWIDTYFPNGNYVEGFVYLEGEGEVTLSLPFMGFYGQWDDAPVFDEGFWYDDGTWLGDYGYVTANQYPHYLFANLSGDDYGWVLGMNPYTGPQYFADEYGYPHVYYNPANNVLSPNGDDAMDGITDMYLSLMRNAEDIQITYTDANGNVLAEAPLWKESKTMYLSNYGQVVPVVWSWTYGDNWVDFSGLEDGDVVYLSISGVIDYENAGWDVLLDKMPIYIDTTAPVLDTTKIVESSDENGNYITLTFAEAHPAAVITMNNSGTQIYDYYSDLDMVDNEDGTYTVTLDITDLGDDITVAICDYGCNEAFYDLTWSQTGTNNPVLEEGTLYGYRVFDYELSMSGYTDYMYGWHAINKETAELTEQTSDYMEYYSIVAAEYVDGLVYAVDAGENLIRMVPGVWNRYHIVNIGVQPLDMTFDDTNDTMYVLYKNDSSRIVLATMDLLTGELTTLQTYSLYYGPWCITDVNGELYVGRYYTGKLGKLDKENGYALVDLKDYKESNVSLSGSLQYTQSMTYSEADNCIYWARFAGSSSNLVKIDMTYAEVNDFIITQTAMPGIASLVGLFVLEETDYQLPESTAAEQITLDKTHLQILVGESQEIVAGPLPWNAPLGELTWTSSNEDVATVENGVVTGVGEGYAEITVTDGTLSAACTVRVIEISTRVNGYNLISMTTGQEYTGGYWFDLNLNNMELNATAYSPVEFYAADYNGHDGKIYGYDGYGQFYSYDPVTGEAVKLGNGVGAENVPYDMAYDYSTGTMYAATYNADYGMGSLSTVDLSNGTITELHITLDYDADWGEAYYSGDPIMTLTWSDQGLLAVTGSGRLVHLVNAWYNDSAFSGEYQEGLAFYTIMEGLGELVYNQSMAYDHATDKLVWASMENYSIVWMDPWDPAIVLLGLPEDFAVAQFVGLYIIPETIPELPSTAVQSVTAEDITMITNAVKAASVTVNPSNATSLNFAYTSDNEAVATVDEHGNVTAVAPGTATITVKVTGEENSSAETSFTVTVLQGGATIYGHLAGDAYDSSSQYWLWLEDYDPSNIDTQSAVWADRFYYSAEYCAETGYVYAYGYNTEDWNSSWYFVTLDPAKDWAVVNEVEKAGNFPFVYDMTYNYVEGIMYAVADVSDTSSDLYMVDLNTGALLPVMDLVDDWGEELCVLGLAADANGDLYAMANSTEGYDWMTGPYITDAALYKLDVENQYAEFIGYTGFKHNKLGSMAFDLDTGNLYWASYYQQDYFSAPESNLCLVDTEYGTAISLGTPSVAGAAITGMYILAEEDSYPESTASLDLIVGQSTLSGYVGDQLQPSVLAVGAFDATITWTSADENIATVDENGVVTAVAPGATSVTITVTDGSTTVSATFGISVIAEDAYFLAYNNKTNTWEKIYRQNPVNVETVGSATEAALLVAENVNGVIYAYDADGNFYSLDAAALESTLLGTVDLSGFHMLRDLAYDAVNDRLLALITDEYYVVPGYWYDEEYGAASVYQVNLETGALVKLVEIDDSFGTEALSVGLDGTVYLLDEAAYPTQDSIYALNMETGEKTYLNSLNRVSMYTDRNYAQSMVTDPLTGVLYILSTSNGNYYTLNSFDPATNLVATHGRVSTTGYTGNTYNTIVSVDTHTHVFVGEAEAVADDCASYDATSRYCLYCGEVITVNTDHSYKLSETVAPTCTEAGYELHKCADCAATVQKNLVSALGHDEELTREASCTEYAQYTCTRADCGNVREDTASLLDHELEQIQYANCLQVDIWKCVNCEYSEEGGYGDHTNPDPDNTPDCTTGFDCSVCQEHVDGYSQHRFVREVIEKDCVNDGSRTYSCNRCETVKTFVLEAPGHAIDGQPCQEGLICAVCGEVAEPTAEHTPGADATCTTDQTCTVCGDVLTPAAGHTSMIIPGYAPTCTEPGMTSGSMCIVCRAVLNANRETPADGHTEVIDEAVAATCTEPGLTEGKHCDVCGEILVAQEEVAALGHTEVIDEAVAATCTEPGLTEGKHCDVCGEVLVAQEEVAALGHSYESVVTAPTCYVKGYTTHTCSNCGDSYTDSVTAVRTHSWDDGVIVKEPTCTRPGSKQISCAYDDCDAFYFDNLVPALGHSYESVVTAPTCTEEGYTTHTCATCGDVEKDSFVAATGHSFGEWSVTKEATRKEVGEETRTCACGETETREIPMVEGMNPAIIVVIVIVVIAAAAVVVFFVLKKKRA